MFEKFEDIETMKQIKEEIEKILKDSKGIESETGLIDPFHLLDNMTNDDLELALEELDIEDIPDSSTSKTLKILQKIQENFNTDEKIRSQFRTIINYLRNFLQRLPDLE